MKTQIDIITGFLGSGKTTFINGLLQSDTPAEERIVILLCETGEEEIGQGAVQDERIHIERVRSEEINAAFVGRILKKYFPQRIIIEHNGMTKVEELLFALGDRKVTKSCEINTVLHMIDASTFDVFMNNMGAILMEQISNSDAVIINNRERLPRRRINNITKTVAAMNKSAHILSIYSQEECRLMVEHGEIYREKRKLLSKPSDKLFAVLFALITLYFLAIVYRAIRQTNPDLSGLQTFNTVFLSILIQAFPFILFGVFVSSVIQVFISEETIVKFFPRSGIAAFGAAVVSGVLFPVCDCAIVPVVGRLVKKGVPLPVAVTFMLAAPIVNPIVIASTFYAFPGQPSVVFYRTLLGIAIAVVAGLMFVLFPEKKSMLANGVDALACKCGFCSRDYVSSKGALGKINAIFMHAAAEFFEVGRFLIMGAFISTAMLTLVPKEILAGLGGENTTALLIMMASAFIFSVCSTSDAFIARTFTSQFALGPVMGFLVLGPMFDIKNLLMLMGSFKKRFVIKLVLIIVAVSFALLYVASATLF